MCTLCYVDDAMKKKIAAYGASFRKATASPFGASDEIGMLNLITAESRDAILSTADAGKMIDLSVDYFVGMPSWVGANDPNYQMWMTHTPAGEKITNSAGVAPELNDLVSYSSDAASMYTHCGTHIDALNHFGYHGVIFNGYKAADHIGSRHWDVAGVNKQPPIVARGVLLDVAGLHGVDILPPSYGIGSEDLKKCLQHQNTELRPGDVVMVRTGRMRVWPNVAGYMNNTPGINRDGAEALAKAGAMVIGSDTFCLEQMPTADPENWQVVHTYLLAEAGVPIMEIVDLEELAAEKLYEFVFFGAGLRLRGATGAPMRPVAMPIRR
jgi:kynurenine formamidase